MSNQAANALLSIIKLGESKWHACPSMEHNPTPKKWPKLRDLFSGTVQFATESHLCAGVMQGSQIQCYPITY